MLYFIIYFLKEKQVDRQGDGRTVDHLVVILMIKACRTHISHSRLISAPADPGDSINIDEGRIRNARPGRLK